MDTKTLLGIPFEDATEDQKEYVKKWNECQRDKGTFRALLYTATQGLESKRSDLHDDKK